MKVSSRAVVAVVCVLMAGGVGHATSFTIDMDNNSQVAHGTSMYQTFKESGTGTGNFDTYLRISDNDSVVWGYNNDAETHENTDQVDENWTRSVALIDVPKFEIDGTDYREFALDANEGGNKLVEITKLEIYTVNNNRNINVLTTLQGQGHLAYSLDGGGDDGTVIVDAAKGSGNGDVLLYIPDDDFDVFGNSEVKTNVYLYCEFASNSDGFEEWGRIYSSENPLPGEMKVLEFEDVDLDGELDEGEPLLDGWDFLVEGPDAYSQAVVTGGDGTFTLSDLAPGEYSITATNQPGWGSTTPDLLSVTVIEGALTEAEFGDAVPEPGALGMIGLALLAVRRRRS